MVQANADNTTPLHFVDPIELRKKMVVAVDRLLAALDALDAVTEDLEEDDPGGGNVEDEGEPSLGATLHPNQEKAWKLSDAETYNVDFEEEHDGCEPDVDDEPQGDEEPSLGSIEEHPTPGSQYADEGDQRGWASCSFGIYDAEYEHDGREPDCDCEPEEDRWDNPPSLNPG